MSIELLPAPDEVLGPILREIVDNLTRRELIAGALAGLLVGACGGDDGDDQRGAATRTVTDAFGDPVDIPVRPQRIVATDYYSAGNLLSLGVPLVGTLGAGGQLESTLTDFFETADVTPIGGIGDDLDFEAIVALDPDLIVEYVHPDERPSDATVARLRTIAPYLMVEAFTDGLVPLADRTVEALGVDPAVLGGMRAEYDAVVEEIRGLLGDRWADVVVGNGHFPGGESANVVVWAATTYNGVTEIVDAIGASRLNQTDERWVLSYEEVREIDCDLLIRTGVPLDEVPATFGELQVVQAGQVIADLPEYWAGLHFPARIGFAKFFLDRLTAMMPIRTDIV